MKSLSTEKVRHLVVRADQNDTLPDSLVTELRDQAVTCGFVRGSGVLRDVSLRAYGSELGGLAPARHIAGPVHVLSLEGSVGLSGGDISLGLHAVLGRETDRGMETLAGEIVSARVVGLELLVAAFDEHATTRALDPAARIWLLGEADPKAVAASPSPAPRRDPRPELVATTPPPPAWNEAIAASASPERPKPSPVTIVGAGGGVAMPPKPVRVQKEEESALVPEAGSLVDHFAFGKCDVLKSEDDRLYLKMHRDGRIKEIALEMLKVTPLEDEDGKKSYRLARKL
jgi:predicted DNA-binding protein with PD1-like motif